MTIVEFMDRPWKWRVLYYLLIPATLFVAVSSRKLWIFSYINCVTLGMLLQGYMSFERQARYERLRQLEALRPWFETVIRMKWVLRVTENLPGYLQLRLMEQEFHRAADDHAPRLLMRVFQTVISSLEEP